MPLEIPEDVWLQFCFICCGTGEQVMDASQPCLCCGGSGFIPHACSSHPWAETIDSMLGTD